MTNVYFLFQTERHFIMQVVCEATQCPDTRVSNASVMPVTFDPSNALTYCSFRCAWRPCRTW